MPSTEVISSVRERGTRDMAHCQCDVPGFSSEPYLPGTCLDERIIALSCLKNCHSCGISRFVNMGTQILTANGHTNFNCQHHIEGFQIANREILLYNVMWKLYMIGLGGGDSPAARGAGIDIEGIGTLVCTSQNVSLGVPPLTLDLGGGAMTDP